MDQDKLTWIGQKERTSIRTHLEFYVFFDSVFFVRFDDDVVIIEVFDDEALFVVQVKKYLFDGGVTVERGNVRDTSFVL